MKQTKQTSHTPGPWTVLYSSNVYPSVHAGKTNTPIATLYAHTPNRGESDVFENSDANARLIAAAPELLEALDVITALILEEDPKHVPALMARKLINKATGGAE